MNAVLHQWMGRPLLAYPDHELRHILAILEDVAFGRPVAGRPIERDGLIARIADLDAKLDTVRPIPVEPASLYGVLR